ncbi:MAG: type II secretion system F family protein, partial [Chromatiaceae bacterium]
LNLAKEVVGNRKLASLMSEAGEELKRGRGLAQPFTQREILPQMALQMVRVGEESGALDAMLAKVAAIYDKETQLSVKRLLTLLEPALIIGLGVVVAGIIISIIVPILGANDLVK